MKTNILAGILVLASISPTAPSKAIEKRNPKGPFSLIAYGVAPSYIKIFYSDGLAYAGDSSLWTYGQVTTDVTFVINNTQLTTTATTSGVTLGVDTLFYIQPIEKAVTEVGFTGNGAVPSSAVTSNFLFYGPYLMWEESGGEVVDSFRLKVTNVSGVYQLYWDQSNLYPSGYLFPVVKSLS
ncbi:hypothetical protein PENDEC_c003G04754 [Penicillium decumbens]|uniref:Uncharacterized protein n=1 Tax=Penicillium decumbens TaxID=69771 RepID=A0A1V6PIX9_PENDC|nr:hypothetical protein PENDEC_c003G04754 [Penicillium decumbens]